MIKIGSDSSSFIFGICIDDLANYRKINKHQTITYNGANKIICIPIFCANESVGVCIKLE